MEEIKYAVVESCDNYICCHGSGLSLAEAHSLVMGLMFNDTTSTEDKLLQNVKMFKLDCNAFGLGVEYEYCGNKTTYYILDDPGRARIVSRQKHAPL